MWGKESYMAFEAITTQEQLDSVIGERLERERNKVHSEYTEKLEGYEALKEKATGYESQIEEWNKTIEENNGKIEEFEKSAGEMQAKLKGYETNSVKMRIANEMGIPFELASKLSGDDEEAIRKDAETVSKFIAKRQPGILATNEPNDINDKTTAMRNMLNGLKGE